MSLIFLNAVFAQIFLNAVFAQRREARSLMLRDLAKSGFDIAFDIARVWRGMSSISLHAVSAQRREACSLMLRNLAKSGFDIAKVIKLNYR